MVQGAHYILGPFGQDSDLRFWGLKLAERGRKNAKQRAVIAVARKLAVLLHKLWVSGEVYEPLANNHRVVSAVAWSWIRTAELNRRDQVTATLTPGRASVQKTRAKVDYHVAALTEFGRSGRTTSPSKGVQMSENTTEMMRVCFEKIDAGGEDAQFFQRVHDALLEARHESEMIGRLDEARVWLAKWREPLEWATGRIEMLQRNVERKGIVIREIGQE